MGTTIRVLVLVVFGVLLAACVGTSAPPVTDPDMLVAMGQVGKKQTEQAHMDQVAQETRQAAKDQQKTEREIALIMAPVQAEQTKVALESTQVAYRITEGAAKITQSAAERQAQLDQLEMEKAQKDAQIAMDRADRQNVREATWNQFFATGRPVLMFLFGLVFVWLLWFLPPRFQARWIERDRENQRHRLLEERKKNSILLLGDGSKAYFDIISGQLEGIIPPSGKVVDGQIKEVWSDGEPIRQMGGQVVRMQARPTDKTATGRVLQVVEAAIYKEGEFGVCIPRYEKLNGISSYKWQEATNILERDGIIDEKTVDGTFLAEGGKYVNLKALRDAIVYEGLVFRPLAKKVSPPTLPLAGD